MTALDLRARELDIKATAIDVPAVVPAANPDGTDAAIQPSIERRFLHASGLVTAGNVSSRVISLFIGIVSARLLTEAEFGALGLVQSTLSMFGAAAGLSLSLAATRYVAFYRASAPTRVRSVVLLVLSVGTLSITVTTIGLWLGAPWLVQRFLNGNAAMVGPLRWASIQLAATAAFGIAAGVLTGRERFGVIGFTTALQNVVILAASAVLIPWWRLSGAIVAQAIGLGVALIVAMWWLRDSVRFSQWKDVPGAIRAEGRLLVDFCVPSVLSSAVLLPATWAATVIVVNQPGGYAALAYFTAADRFRLLLNFVAGFVGTALLPILTGATARDNAGSESRRGMELGFIGTGMMVLPLTALFAFGGPAFMAAFGRGYSANWSVLLPVIAWGASGAIGSVVGTALMAQGRQWFLFAQQSVYGVTVLTVTFLLRGKGGVALAIGHLTAVVMLVVWSYRPLRKAGVLSDRAAAQLFGLTAFVCALCAASWVCPPQWRSVMAVPATLASFAVALMLPTSSDRRRLIRLVSSREAMWRAVRGTA